MLARLCDIARHRRTGNSQCRLREKPTEHRLPDAAPGIQRFNRRAVAADAEADLRRDLRAQRTHPLRGKLRGKWRDFDRANIRQLGDTGK